MDEANKIINIKKELDDTINDFETKSNSPYPNRAESSSKHRYHIIRLKNPNSNEKKTAVRNEPEVKTEVNFWDTAFITQHQGENLNANQSYDRSLIPVEYSAFKRLNANMQSASSPCLGQGDESRNSFILTPESSTPGLMNDFPETKVPTEGSEIHMTPDGTAKILFASSPRSDHLNRPDSLIYETPKAVYLNPSVDDPHFHLEYLDNSAQITLQSPKEMYENISPIPIPSPGCYRLTATKAGYQPYIMPRQLQSTPMTTTDSSLESSSRSYSSMSYKSGSSTPCSSSTDYSSPEYPRVPNNTPNSGEDLTLRERIFHSNWLPAIASRLEYSHPNAPIDFRQKHNQTERHRRKRIKTACEAMRSILPGVTSKTDNTTVFQDAVNYITFLRNSVGDAFDEEFVNEHYV